jgi:serine/threonine-protein kinase
MPDLVGKVIGEYQIVEIIDDARSVVYKGFQPSANQYVAVKVLKPRQARDQAAVQAFTKYAERAASYRHPNILPVLESGQINDANYLVTPFMDNQSVADHLYAYADAHQAQSLINAMLPGLEYIYAQGYIHGNLRPSNIMLDPQGRPLLADFGMPFPIGESPTPYNSPEQVQGGLVDQRSDVYALGIILYELLAGQAPDPGMVVNLRGKRPDLGTGLEQVILKSIAQNPVDRYQSPRDFIHACANALQTVPQEPVAQSDQLEALPLGVPLWVPAAMGVLFTMLFCSCMLLAGPLVMDFFNLPRSTATWTPTQTQGLPVVTATLVTTPTLMPTQMPAQPLVSPTWPPPTQGPPPQQPPAQQPPVQAPPVQQQPPVQQPSVQAPPIQQPPGQQPPTQASPVQGAPGQQPTMQAPPAMVPVAEESPGFPGCCGSLGFAGGLALLGGVFTRKYRGQSSLGKPG